MKKTAKLIHLQNDFVRFSFEARTGSLAQVENRRTGRTHLTDRTGARLFRVICPHERWQSRYADSHEACPPKLEVAPGRLTIHYPALQAPDGPSQVSVTVRVELPADQPEARFSLELTNHDEHRLHEVHFPWVGGWTGFAGREKDRGLCGILPATLYPRCPEVFHHNLSGSQRRQFYPYTSGMCLPFFDLSGGDRGLSYICYQERPNLGGMMLYNLDPEPDQLCLSFAWVHYPFTRPGATWRSPVIGVGVHAGDWHATADRYRAWLQRWWRPPSPPARLRHSIGMQVVQLRNFDGRPLHGYRGIPRLAAAGRKYGVDDLSIWDPIAGLYLRPDDGDFWEEFDPAQTLDDLRAALATARRAGTDVSTLVNYRLIRGYSSLFRKIGENQVQRTIFGAPAIEEWTTCTAHHAAFRTNYLGRLGTILCQKSAPFRQRALEVTQQTLDLGFTSLFIDQAFDYNPCFVEQHGHRAPDDTHEAAIEWFSEAARLVRERDPAAYVIGEVTDVFGLQHIDLNWFWGWCSTAPEVMRYTLPETVHCWPVDHQPAVLNRAFAMGFLMALTTAQAEQSLARYPAFGARVARLAKLRKRCAAFVADGRFRDNLGLSKGDATAYVFASDKGLAVTLAELNNRPQTVRLTLDPSALGYNGARTGSLYRQDGSRVRAGRATRDGTIRLEARLRPLEGAVWIIPARRGRAE